MPTYIMLSTLTPEGVQTVKNNPPASARSTTRSSSSGRPSRRSGRRSATSTSSTSSRRPTRRRWRASRSSSARAAPAHYETLDRDPDRRLHRRALVTKVLVVGGGGREHAIVRALRALAAAPGGAVRARQRRHPRDARRLDVDAGDPAALAGAARDAGVDLVVVGPEAPLVAGLADALRGRGRARASGPSAAAARLEGSKAFAKEIMEAAGVPTGGARGRARPSTTGMAAIAALPGRDQGRRAGGRQGRRDRGRRGRGARRARGDARRAPLRRRTRCVVEEFLERRRAVAARAVRRRARAAARARRATTSASATATPGPNTGGMGAYSPVAGDRRRAARGRSRATVHQPVVDELRAPRHAVPRRPLRRADAHRRRRRRCSSSTSASATPRRRPCCRGCARTCSTCCCARRGPAGWRASSSSGTRARRSRVVLASRGYPAVVLHRAT